MGETSAANGSRRSKAYRTNRKRLSKAQLAATHAKRNVVIATKQLTKAVRALVQSRSGTSKEARQAKAVRATTKGFVSARKKLRRAEKRRKKAAARLFRVAPRPAR